MVQYMCSGDVQKVRDYCVMCVDTALAGPACLNNTHRSGEGVSMSILARRA